MSKVVDERVVSMEFDNKRFEHNVETSMHTIDKLKNNLKFNGATKGLENLNTASKKIDFKDMEYAAYKTGFHIEDVWHKLTSVLEYDIARRWIAVGKNVVSSFTIDPIKTGLQEYETQINAVQTILANTSAKGSTLQDVNAALGELNTYADKTIYNFTEMTKNIGTFTAAGVKLDDSVAAIKGISNLAAVSGATSQQASNAMYQLSQALSSGTVKLMDWNSVVNAGMGGEVFQNALKETAKVHGKNVDSMIKKEGSFRDTLSKGWLTSEILLETLSKFTGDLSEEQLETMGYTEEQIEQIIELGKTANDAATKVKTFTQLMDTLKEAAQSGWTKTWELMLGDFDEAKEVWTRASDYIGNALNAMSDARNKLVQESLSSGWKQLLSQGITDENLYIESIKKVGDEINKTDEYYDKLIDKEIEDEKAKGKIITKQKAFQNLLSKGQVSVETLTKAYDEYVASAKEKFEDEGINSGFTDENIKNLEKLQNGLKDGSITFDEFYKKITRPSGRENIIESISNSVKGLAKVLGTVRDAFLDVFFPNRNLDGPNSYAERIYRFTEKLKEFSEKLIMSDETADKLRRTLKGIFAIFDILGTILLGPIKIGLEVIKSLLKEFDINILDLTASLGDNIIKIRDWIDAHNPIKKVIEKIAHALKIGIEAFNDWIDTLKESDNIPRDIIKGLINGLSKGIGYVIDAAKQLGSALIDAVKERLGIHSPSTEFYNIATYCISGFINGFKDGMSKISDGAKWVWSKLVEAFTGATSNEKYNELYAKMKAKFEDFKWQDLIPLALTGSLLIFAFKLIKIANILISPIETFSDLVDDIGGIVERFKGVVSAVRRVANTAALYIFAESMFTLAKSLAVVAASVMALSYLEPAKLWSTIGAVSTIMLAMGSVILAMSKLGATKIEVAASAGTIASFGAAMLLMATTIKILANIPWEDAKKAMIVMAAMTGMMGAMVLFTRNYGSFSSKLQKSSAFDAKKGSGATGSFTKDQGSGGSGVGSANGVGGTLIGMAIAMLMIANAVKIIGSIKWEDAKQAMIVMAAITGMMAVLILVSRDIGSFSNKLEKNKSLVKFIGKSKIDKSSTAKGISGSTNGVSGMLFSMAFAMLMIANAVKIIASVSEEGFARAKKIIFGILGFLLTITILNTAGSIFSKVAKASTSIKISAGIMFGISFALLSIAISIKMIADIGTGEIWRAAGVIGALIGALGIVAKFLSVSEITIGKAKGTNAVMKVGGLFFALGVGILSIALAMKIIAGMEWDEIIKGSAVIGGLLIIMSALVITLAKISQKSSDLSGEAKKSRKAIIQSALTLVAMSASLLLMAAAIYILGKMPLDTLIQGGIAVVVLLGIMAAVLLAASKIKDGTAMKTLIAMTAMIAVLAIAIGVLSFVNWYDLIAPTIAIGMLVGLMIFLANSLKEIKIDIKPLIVLTVAIGVIALSIGLLSLLDAEKVMMSSLSISAVLFVFVQALESLSKKGSSITTGLASLIVMTVAIGVIAGAIWLVSQVDSGTALLSAVAISLVLAVFTTALILVSKQGSSITTGLASLIVMTVAIALIAGSLYLVGQIDPVNTLASALGISAVLLALVGALVILGAIKTIAVKALVGVGIITIILLALVGSLLLMTKIDPSTMWTYIAGIGVLLGGLLAACLILAGIGVLAYPILIGTGVFLAVATALASVVLIMAGVSYSLPGLGDNLSDFADKVTPFVETMKTIDGKLVIGVASLSAAILLLTGTSFLNALGTLATDFIDGLRTLFGGDDSLTSLLKKFAGAIVAFDEKLGGANLDSLIIAANALQSLTDFQNINLDKFKSAITQIIEIAKDVSKMSASDYSGIKSLVDSLTPIRQLATISVANLALVIDELNQLMDLATKASSLDFSGMHAFGESLKGVAEESVNAFIKAFETSVTKVTEAVNAMLLTVSVSVGQSAYDDFLSIGGYIVSGIADGIDYNTYRVEAKARAMARAAARAAEEELDIESPSKEFQEMGTEIPEGMASGIEKFSDKASDSAKEMAKVSIDGTSEAISKVADAVNADLDTQPVIRPVLDLSDVETKTAYLNQLFGGKFIVANAAAINNSVQTNQTRATTTDILTAVAALGSKLKGNSSNVYNINGVTYDDGSNVASAVQSLIRAAKIERRI